MNHGKLILFAVVSIVFLHIRLASFGQDPTFTQYEYNPLYFNPATTGESFGPRVVVNYRDQWYRTPGLPAIPGSIHTVTASYDMPVCANPRHGIGFQLMNDYEGEGLLRYTSISAGYAFHAVRFNRFHKSSFVLSLGLQPSVNQIAIKWDRLVFSDQINKYNESISSYTSFVPPTDGNRWFLDFAGGGRIKWTPSEYITMEGGGTISHLPIWANYNSLLGADERIPFKYSVNFSSSISMSNPKNKTAHYLTPKFYWLKQDPYSIMHAGFGYIRKVREYFRPIKGFRHNQITTGILYKNKNLQIKDENNKFIVGYFGLTTYYNETEFQFIFSYEVNSGLKTGLGGNAGQTFEISILTSFNQNNCLIKRNSSKRSSRKSKPSRGDFECPARLGNPLM